MNPFWEFFLLAMCGVTLHFLKKLIDFFNYGRKIKWPVFILSMLSSVLICTGLVYARDSFADLYPMTPLTAIILGFCSQSIFTSLVSFKRKVAGGNEPDPQ